METAFFGSDRSFDGLFWAGVRTTGIFCRPSCPARKPRPENVEYFGSVGEALRAGFRACRRCDPTLAGGEAPSWLRPLLALMDREPDRAWTGNNLRELGLEPARVRRWFQQNRGMTLAAHCRSRRLGRALETMAAGGALDDAALGHGFESHSGFRDAFVRHFHRPPGEAADIPCACAEVLTSPLGPLLVAGDDDGICLLEFAEPERVERTLTRLKRRMARPVVPGTHRHLRQLKAELEEYFSGRRREFTVPVRPRGTAFQERVWSALQGIPHGETRSYAELAARVGSPKGQRAVGLANGSNPIAIVIPCHRVVNADGALGGYGGGLLRKRLLLELEQTGRPLGGE